MSTAITANTGSHTVVETHFVSVCVCVCVGGGGGGHTHVRLSVTECLNSLFYTK